MHTASVDPPFTTTWGTFQQNTAILVITLAGEGTSGVSGSLPIPLGNKCRTRASPPYPPASPFRVSNAGTLTCARHVHGWGRNAPRHLPLPHWLSSWPIARAGNQVLRGRLRRCSRGLVGCPQGPGPAVATRCVFILRT